MRIVVAGTGYVGLGREVLLTQHNEEAEFDVNYEKVFISIG